MKDWAISLIPQKVLCLISHLMYLLVLCMTSDSDLEKTRKVNTRILH